MIFLGYEYALWFVKRIGNGHSFVVKPLAQPVFW